MQKHTLPTIQGLYVITDPLLCPNEQLLPKVEAAILGGAQVVQYRDKTQGWAQQQKMAQALRHLTLEHDVCFIINDNIALAEAVQADGVHLGKEDGEPAHVRAILGPEKWIGVSCYNSVQRALAMQQAGANYVAFGRFYPSQTKPDAPAADLQTLHDAKRLLSLPKVAIGGITAEKAPALRQAGADCIAVIHSVFQHEHLPDITQACQQLRASFSL
ncbi:MAG: thiamine phosphate synthase [Thiotrichales bacterium]|nr:thiamine phosphate synthase [Thiotrichales bacterium]